MIRCVEKTGGVVDKFIGDALMAHWGTAVTSGNPADDAYNSVSAALLMRETLIALNAKREKNDPENPWICMGCSINTGMVIAGQIGSEDRMEYTIIGSPVNLANRVESLNKVFGTDILITEDTWKLTGHKLITEEMLPVSIRGVDAPVRLFAVVNFINSGGPQTLAEVRALLGIDTPDLGKLDLEAEEKKYTFKSGRGTDDYKNEDQTTESGNADKRKTNRRKSDRRNSDRRNTDRRNTVRAIISRNPDITMTSFGPTAWVQGSPGEAIPVFFSWNTSGFDPETHIKVEVALDQYFENIVEERDVSDGISVSIPLSPGLYWWRVYPVSGGVVQPFSRNGEVSREGEVSGSPLIRNFPFGTLMVSTNEKEKKN
jgi:hypothetical protein